ncbi:hypothetical protein [Holzapfeliella floricola]|uniref:hypothetical protein n=1 Tax=Holzapfeliella floricola TaxID=679249 RepID=UPI001A92EDC9|nr:hypothetical protein [Holzapfeliella floricola]
MSWRSKTIVNNAANRAVPKSVDPKFQEKNELMLTALAVQSAEPRFMDTVKALPSPLMKMANARKK